MCVEGCMRVGVHARVSKCVREKVCVLERKSVIVCAREKEQVCLFVREREKKGFYLQESFLVFLLIQS